MLVPLCVIEFVCVVCDVVVVDVVVVFVDGRLCVYLCVCVVMLLCCVLL